MPIRYRDVNKGSRIEQLLPMRMTDPMDRWDHGSYERYSLEAAITHDLTACDSLSYRFSCNP